MFLIEHTRALRNVKRAVPLVIQIQVPAPLVLAPLALLAPQALVPNLTQILTCCHVLTQQSQSQKSLKKILKFVTKYATKGINKRNRQNIAKICPIPYSKKLQGLSLDRFFKRIFFKGKKWNGKLEKNKINTQMRILDALGPLSVLWSEAERISKTGKGMDPSDVIQLVQRAIMFVGNAHCLYNTDRRKAVLAKTMPETVDILSDKKYKKSLGKCKSDLFGKRFLKQLAKDNKDNRELKQLLTNGNEKKTWSQTKQFSDRNRQFFLQRPSSSLQYGGRRQPDRRQFNQSQRYPQYPQFRGQGANQKYTVPPKKPNTQ